MDSSFTAYTLQGPGLDLAVAGQRRAWMDETPGGVANRCLPMLIANQSGWVLLNRGRVTAIWTGGRYTGDCLVEGDNCPELPLSHFGSGIITWRIPYLFRTPLGWNLLVRGPANLSKDGAASLEGVIETDWATQPAFHSWKLTREGHRVTWEDGEPICMILPQRRGELEEWQPRIEDISSHLPLRDEYFSFSESRTQFNATHRGHDWQKHYFRGISPGKARAATNQHQTRLKLREFRSVREAQQAAEVDTTDVHVREV